MAKDTKLEDVTEEEKEEDPVEYLYKITHNLEGGQIIVLRRNTQNYLNHLPEEERVSLGMLNKKGDDNLYFRATKTRAFRILERLENHAREWSYNTVNLKMEIVEEEPEEVIDAEVLERLEEKIGESYKEELGRLHMQIGSLTSDLSRAENDMKKTEQRAIDAECLAADKETKLAKSKETIESLKTLQEALSKGTLADACIQFIHARAENVEVLEMLLADIRDSGLDVSFIAEPPESVERYAKEKLMRMLDVEYRELERCLEIGAAETWEESRLHMPKEELDDATEKLGKLTQTIKVADDSIKAILEENLKTVLGSFNSTVQEYTAKQERYNQARDTYLKHKEAIEQGTDELAKAKQLKTSLLDLRKMKFPVYAVPEQDGATIYLPASAGIAYDSLVNVIKAHALLKSEEEIGGNTVLRIGGNNGNWNPVRVFRAIKESYEQNSEAGKMGSKLGLLVQF